MTEKPAQPQVTAFFDENTNTFSYVVKDPLSNTCAVVDAVLEFDYASGAHQLPGRRGDHCFRQDQSAGR